MKCPACGSEQPDGAIVCATCNAVITADVEAPEQLAHLEGKPVPPEFTYVQAPDPPSVLKLAGAFVGFIAIAFALVWLFSPSGNDVPDDAVVQDEMGYALSAPRGWVVLTKENYNTLTKELAGRLPETLKNDVQAGRIHMGVMKVMPAGQFSPSVNVVISDEAIPRLDQEQKDQAVKLFTAVYKLRMRDFKLLSADLLDIDDIRSLKMSILGTLSFKTGDGGRSVYGAPTQQYQDLRLQFAQIIVPGNKRSYILTATALETQFKIYERTFQQVFDSFRVTDRPPVFGAMITNALKLGLSAVGLYLLYFIISGATMWLRR